MHSIESLRGIRALEHFLCKLPDEFSCDTYPTTGMTLREIHEMQRGRKQIPLSGKEAVTGRARFNLKTGKITCEDYSETFQPGYVQQARAFLKEGQGDYFVIGHIQVKRDYPVPEDPTFWHNPRVGAKVLRTAGFKEDRARRILYHAESPEQARVILGLFLEGAGYSINTVPVMFQRVEEPLPVDLELIADRTIRQYRAVCEESRK